MAPRILIVEDEAIIAMELEDRLERLGYEIVAQVSDSDAAIAIAASEKPDLVLMDIHLHGSRDGIETAAAIRRQREVAIVYVSAHADEPTLERARSTGLAGYLIKPFRADQLRAVIDVALRSR